MFMTYENVHEELNGIKVESCDTSPVSALTALATKYVGTYGSNLH